jgi:hypothetical protein
MASGKKARKGRSSKPVISRKRGVPWLMIGAVAVVLALGVTIGVVVLSTVSYSPSASNQDPSLQIDGVYADPPKYKSALHVQSTQRVDYDRYPPVGGPHDGYWAACNGVVYPVAMRDENMVHTLEHGAIWIAYNPDTIAAGDLDILRGLVVGQQFMVMSPYPTLTSHPISLQAWGHQLQVDSASDARVQQFITALRRNQYVYPEIGATCDQPSFPTVDIPAELRFDPSPRGADAVPLDGGELAADTSEMTAPATSGAGSAGG